MWVTKLLISPVKKKYFLPKNDQIWAKTGIFGHLGQALPAHLVPCWWFGWWLRLAGSISQDTFLLHIFIYIYIHFTSPSPTILLVVDAWQKTSLNSLWIKMVQMHFLPLFGGNFEISLCINSLEIHQLGLLIF